MSYEQKKEKQKQREVEWRAELVRLHRRQADGIDNEIKESNHRHNTNVLASVQEKMRSADFRAWYEATTGLDVSYFLDRVAISPIEFRNRFGAGMSQIEWTQNVIQRIADSNPWTNPETRVYWAAQVGEAKDPQERRAILMRLATPPWANRAAVLKIYKERERISAVTGIPHDVDHIIPIVHPEVCGLHYDQNLRIIPASENRSKSNLFNGSRSRARKD